MSEMHLVPLPRLNAAMRLVVRGFGSGEAEVEAVASNLIEANLTGHDSHGVGMLPRYADAFLEGGLKPNVHVSTVMDGGAMLRLDGNAGFGQVIGQEAMALGIERAQKSLGSCIVALGNSHHLGRIGAWAEQCGGRRAGVDPLRQRDRARHRRAATAAADARFGTNPFCAGLPLSGREPVILDFATSVIAQGKTRVAHNKGEAVAPGCLIDDHGCATTDPRYSVVPPFGALLTFGTHKGYGLALMCELLGGALAAGMTQRTDDASQRRVLNGMFSVLLDPAKLAEPQQFESEALAFIEWVKASPPREGFEPVSIAGEPERAWRARRTAEGVPIDATTWQEILTASDKLGVGAGKVQAAAGVG